MTPADQTPVTEPPSGAAGPRPEPDFPVQPRAAAALARAREITTEIETHRAAVHALALERADLVRLARTGLTLAQVATLLGISGPAVAKLQRRH